MKTLRPYQQDAVNECWQALRKNDEPVLLMASVGSGKSLMLASILLAMQKAQKRGLCLVNNAELVRNNCDTFNQQGGNASIYCAALNEKDSTAPIIFATPQSLLNAINKNEDIGKIRFNIIVIDEAHTINYLNYRSAFMRILRHFKQEYPPMRVLGATGTNFRFKGAAIVGEECLFKTQVGNITTESLIEQNYLINPNFQVDQGLIIDFSSVKIKRNGQFDTKQLEQIVSENARLTELICKQLVHIMQTQERFGAFIFATTRRHAEEILSHLPENQSALILGDTPQQERTKILNDARSGKIKYLVNIAIISVGVDVPPFDTIAYLRPTESLVLLVQTIGRALRLSPKTNKTEALILDYAGNIERHSDWDNPILLKALKETQDPLKPLVIICPKCMQRNTDTARRCVGKSMKVDTITQKPKEERCDYFFEFKECPNEACRVKNDIASRHCRECQTEIIDPNKKLSLQTAQIPVTEVFVLGAKFHIRKKNCGFSVIASYHCRDKKGQKATYYESYTPNSEKAKHVFYGQFIKNHCEKPSSWYIHLDKPKIMGEMLASAKIPCKIIIKQKDNGYIIKKKIFHENLKDYKDNHAKLNEKI